MPRGKTLSGKKVIDVLVKQYGFSVAGQKGSHIKLRKTEGNKIITTIVPNHRELARGTLSGILELARIDTKDFLKRV